MSTTQKMTRTPARTEDLPSGAASNYRMCVRCIMDTSDPDIQFDENGFCNHCRKYEEKVKIELCTNEEGQRKLERLVTAIKKAGEGKEYDCIVGVSGGVDSTMVAYLVKEKLKLRPLAVHMDNGWNSELAVSNVERTLKALDIDLYTYVIDWEEFKDLQLSFLKASVTNCEIPTDHAIMAILYQIAAKHGMKYILSGTNVTSEGIHLPPTWGYDAKDWRQVKGIHKRFGSTRLKSFPQLKARDFLYYTFVKGIRFVPILNYFPYVKEDAKKLLERELDWRDYGGKHYESIYTRFYQAYILPQKFNIDKRRVHLSTLICSKQMTREQALEEIEQELYEPDKLIEDRDFVIKKLGLTDQEFEEIMARPIKTYRDYPSNYLLLKRWPSLIRWTRNIATGRT